jgi:uncharacterized protein YjdB
MKRKNFYRFINNKALLIAGLIALVFCMTFTSCEDLEVNDVTGFTLSQTGTINIAEGDVDYLYVTNIQPAGAAYKNVTWKTSEPGAVTVSNGKITTGSSSANKTAVVTATVGSVSKSCTFKVTASSVTKQVTGVTLNIKTLPLGVNGMYTLSSVVKPDDALNTDVFYTSSNPAVAKVDPVSGTVTGVSAGIATITVTTKNKNKTDTCAVTVTAGSTPGLVPVTGVTLDKDTLILAVNATANLVPTVLPSGATNKNVTWESDDPSKATVDSTGKVTAVAAGNTTIYVITEEGEFEARCLVVVTANASESSVALNKTSLFLVKGGTASLAATVLPANSTVTWISSSTVIASILAGGVGCSVSGAGGGTATITVTMDSDVTKTATCTVTVIDPAAPAVLYNTYTTKYGTTTETIKIESGKIYITDGTGSTADFLEFTITKWETGTTPDKYKSSYPIALKITGKITGAKPDSPNLYGSSTAPGFTVSDINNTECWMYLYIDNDGKFIRAPFSKANKNNGTVAVQENNNGSLRIYSKVTATP